MRSPDKEPWKSFNQRTAAFMRYKIADYPFLAVEPRPRANPVVVENNSGAHLIRTPLSHSVLWAFELEADRDAFVRTYPEQFGVIEKLDREDDIHKFCITGVIPKKLKRIEKP